MQRGAVLKLFNKLRLQRSLRTKNTGAAQLADIICVSATSLVDRDLEMSDEHKTDLELDCTKFWKDRKRFVSHLRLNKKCLQASLYVSKNLNYLNLRIIGNTKLNRPIPFLQKNDCHLSCLPGARAKSCMAINYFKQPYRKSTIHFAQ